MTPAQHGLGVEYRQDYDSFAAGYTETGHISVYAGSPLSMPYDPQRPNLDVFVPVVLLAERALDGSFATYRGCYLTGRVDVNDIRIITGRLEQVNDTPPTVDSILNLFASEMCVALANEVGVAPIHEFVPGG